MADPFSITCGVLSLITVALSSTVKLTNTIRSFQEHDKRTLALKRELIDLATVLESLHELVTASPDVDFDSLRSPLDRCGCACEEYGQLIARFTKHSNGQRTSIRDWVSQKYLWGDVVDFKDMLASYKSTINIAIAKANIQVAAITPQVLESYRVMMSDTNEDLQQHLRDIEAKIDALSSKERSKANNADLQAILDEKKSTKQGLKICEQLSTQIDQLSANMTDGEGGPIAPQAGVYIRSGLGATKAMIQSTMKQLHEHRESIESRVQQMQLSELPSTTEDEELERLQATKQSINQCIQIVSEAGSAASDAERRNVFEDITLVDKSYSFTVSTIGDLVTARRINLSGGSYNVGGQITDDAFKTAIDALTREGIKPADDAKPRSMAGREAEHDRGTAEFHTRYGKGVALTPTVKETMG